MARFPPTVVKPRAPNPIVRAIQQAYVDAGSPGMRQLAGHASVPLSCVQDLIGKGKSTRSLDNLVDLCNALGVRVVLAKS